MAEHKRNVYLTTVSLSEALETAKAVLDRSLVKTETVPANEAAGCVCAEPVYSRLSSPTFHSAAMDGVAVRAADTFAAREGRPVQLKLHTGYEPVNTGNPLPEGMDAVVMIENVDQVDETTIALESSAFPWMYVRRIGEDIVATELLFPRNHEFTAYDVGALLGGGVWDAPVWERLRVAIIPTGDEVLDFTTRPTPKPGQVVESNSQVLMALIRQAGHLPERTPPVKDDVDALADAVKTALDSGVHAVVIGAGSSAGSKDYTRKVMEKVGRVLVHGVAAMPGKPSLLGESRGRLLVGAPGYPVSAVVCAEELLLPLLAWLSHKEPASRPKLQVELSRKSPSKPGREEFLRLSVGKVDDRYVATPLHRGAGNITTLSRAQAVVRIPAASEGIEAGEMIEAELLAPRRTLDTTLVAVGSHDNILDVLADELMDLEPSIRLASSHVGSMGGLTALRNGSAHIAGAHLFDPETGDYNFPFLARYLPDTEVFVVNLAVRHQGLIVAPGNPLGVTSVNDLSREDVRFVNRQRGAGTRILLDYHLKQAGISPDAVNGYGKEEFTHMAVAANVLTGTADAGLGIYAAAKALGLDFAPLAKERYDLVIPVRFAEQERILLLLETIRKPETAERIQGLGGYETRLTGQVMQPGAGLGE